MRLLNVGIIQNNASTDYETNIVLLEERLEKIMSQINKPELVIGTEGSIGLMSRVNEQPVEIPGSVTDKLAAMAKKYKIYFIPGSMFEKKILEEKEVVFNTMPIFNPDGELIHLYRKICPYYPSEEKITPGQEYVVFNIKEKNIKVGVMICHDWCFPEIPRNLTLLGAELLVRVAIDPEGLYENCRHIAEVRALENQAYFVSVNMTGEFLGFYAYGKSIIAGPDGKVVYEAGDNPLNVVVTLDFDQVERARVYGTNYTEQFVRQLKVFKFPKPFEGNIENAPVFENLPDPDLTINDYRKNNINTLRR